jgi:hypothetical protein
MKINEKMDNYDRVPSQYIVAFLDILGSADRIKKETNNPKIVLNTLHNLYTFSMNLTREIAIESYKDIQFKIFSDNIVVVKKLSDQPVQRLKDYECLLNCASHFQCLSVEDSVGWLVRGGITIGDLYIDKTMVWGEALLKSYDLENKIAIYPRIVIDQKLAQEIISTKTLKDYINQDIDNMYYLNYLCIQHFGGQLLMDGFFKMQDELNGKFSDRIFQNLCWHMNYVNRELDKKNERGESKYRLRIR